MDFSLSPELCDLRDRTRAFIAEQVIPLEKSADQDAHGPSPALRTELVERARRAIEIALREKRITVEESARLRRRYEQGLSGYTYLEVEDSDQQIMARQSRAAGG